VGGFDIDAKIGYGAKATRVAFQPYTALLFLFLSAILISMYKMFRIAKEFLGVFGPCPDNSRKVKLLYTGDYGKQGYDPTDDFDRLDFKRKLELAGKTIRTNDDVSFRVEPYGCYFVVGIREKTPRTLEPVLRRYMAANAPDHVLKGSDYTAVGNELPLGKGLKRCWLGGRDVVDVPNSLSA
jgi:hypothetical protein